VANQVVPVSDRPDPNNEFEYGQWLSKNTTRGYLLAIAAELAHGSTQTPPLTPYNNRVNQTTQMTDSDKLFALTEIMGDVLCTLELKQYDIEDPQLSHDCVVDADKFRQRMLNILHSEDT
jgi:hypothetical protein